MGGALGAGGTSVIILLGGTTLSREHFSGQCKALSLLAVTAPNKMYIKQEKRV